MFYTVLLKTRVSNTFLPPSVALWPPGWQGLEVLRELRPAGARAPVQQRVTGRPDHLAPPDLLQLPDGPALRITEALEPAGPAVLRSFSGRAEPGPSGGFRPPILRYALN